MPYRDSQSAQSALHSIAHAQGGYFTAKQAEGAGYSRQHLDYHVSAGNFERVERGLYRVPTIPVAERDDLIRLSLWSRGRDDRPQAVVSHQSALALHELSDVLPGKAHLTVPKQFRKRPPSNAVLHKVELGPKDTVAFAGFRATTPLRTLLDVASAHDVSTEQLELAVRDALERGLVIRRKLLQEAQQAKSARRLLAVLESTG
jgi:predicted transcriptional regulator of viral defense system